MSSTAAVQQVTDHPVETLQEVPQETLQDAIPVAIQEETPSLDQPSIAPHMAQVLDLAQKTNASLTPREINEHLSQILQSYDELTALYGQNSLRIDEELHSLRQAGGTVSSQLHQVHAELQHQGNSLASLSTSTTAGLQSVHTALQVGLQASDERTQAQFAAVNTRIIQDVSRLDSGVQSLGQMLEAQERIVGEQSARLDQFDAAYELLDTATRGNRKRIEAVREETERQHAILTAQVQGLGALQREHYNEFNAVRRLVTVLQSEAQRLDTALKGVAADLSTHVELTRKTFKWTHAAVAGLLLLTVGGFALVKWAPAFAPTSTGQALARSAQDIQALNTQLAHLPPLEVRTDAQEDRMGELADRVASLSGSMGELKKSVRHLNTKIDHAAVQGMAAPVGAVPLLDGHWVAQQNPQAFTVQLIGVGSQEEMGAFIRQNTEFLAAAHLSYTVTQAKGRDRYNLFYGVFDNSDLARAAIEAMPPLVRGNKPWVRQLKAVQSAAE